MSRTRTAPTIRDVLHGQVLSGDVSEPLADIASRMQFHEIGALPVYDGRTLVGIVTERDLVRAAADEASFATTGVGEYMTDEPVAIGPEDSPADAAAAMVRLGARHLPVVEAGELIGMVSARDLLQLLADSRSPAGRS